MSKLDFKKQFKHLYVPSAKEVAIMDVPAMNFVMTDGRGDPDKTPAFQEALQALYGVSFTLKFMLKKQKKGEDYIVSALEGLWWADDMTDFMAHKDDWKWTLMIMQPEFVTKKMFEEALAELKRKKAPDELPPMRFERFHEGLSAQIMHLGPYSAEIPTIERLHKFITDSGHSLRGRHHEIYMSDPRRCAPEKIRTVLRQPIK